jgi:hypothetical protein
MLQLLKIWSLQESLSLFGCTPLASKFSLLREIISVPPGMGTEQTLNHPVWGFIGTLLGMSSCFGLLWIECMVDYFGYDSPSWAYGSCIGLAFGYCLCDNDDK